MVGDLCAHFDAPVCFLPGSGYGLSVGYSYASFAYLSSVVAGLFYSMHNSIYWSVRSPRSAPLLTFS